MNKKYIIRLTVAERQTLREIIKKLKGSSQKVRRAQMLLKADIAGPAWTDAKIAEAFDIPGTKEHPQRIDYEYERAGTASIFMFAEPLAGWRQATARETKTKIDWALEVAALLEGRYAKVPQIVLVCDNLNTHTKGAFYEAFPPARARELVRRIRFCHTPKHGSWLNIAENELSSLTRQCVSGRRFGKIANLQSEIAAWSSDVNNTQRGVDWQMKIGDARRKLKSLYPKIKI